MAKEAGQQKSLSAVVERVGGLWALAYGGLAAVISLLVGYIIVPPLATGSSSQTAWHWLMATLVGFLVALVALVVVHDRLLIRQYRSAPPAATAPPQMPPMHVTAALSDDDMKAVLRRTQPELEAERALANRLSRPVLVEEFQSKLGQFANDALVYKHICDSDDYQAAKAAPRGPSGLFPQVVRDGAAARMRVQGSYKAACAAFRVVFPEQPESVLTVERSDPRQPPDADAYVDTLNRMVRVYTEFTAIRDAQG